MTLEKLLLIEINNTCFGTISLFETKISLTGHADADLSAVASQTRIGTLPDGGKIRFPAALVLRRDSSVPSE